MTEHISSQEFITPSLYLHEFEDVVLPDGITDSQDMRYQMVLSGVTQSDSGLTFRWVGGNSRRHSDLYDYLNLDEEALFPLVLDGIGFGMAARYEGMDLCQIGIDEVKESLCVIVSGDEHAITAHAQEFIRILTTAKDAIGARVQHRSTAKHSVFLPSVYMLDPDSHAIIDELEVET